MTIERSRRISRRAGEAFAAGLTDLDAEAIKRDMAASEYWQRRNAVQQQHGARLELSDALYCRAMRHERKDCAVRSALYWRLAMTDDFRRRWSRIRFFEALLPLLCDPPATVTVAYGTYRETVRSHDITPLLEAMQAQQHERQLSLFEV